MKRYGFDLLVTMHKYALIRIKIVSFPWIRSWLRFLFLFLFRFHQYNAHAQQQQPKRITVRHGSAVLMDKKQLTSLPIFVF